jgi:hypothetical protein
MGADEAGAAGDEDHANNFRMLYYNDRLSLEAIGSA